MLERLYHLLSLPDHPPTRCDFIIALSYAVASPSKLTPMTQAVCDQAISTWQKFKQARIIMSTGDNQFMGIPNSDIMVNYALSHGIPKSRLLNEGRSSNTFENIKYSLELIGPKASSSNIVIVAYDLHMRRAVATAKKLGIRRLFWVSAVAKVKPAWGYKGYFQTRSRFTIFLYDILAIAYSKIRGWL